MNFYVLKKALSDLNFHNLMCIITSSKKPVVIKGSDYRSTTEICSSLPNNSLYFFYCDGGRGISTELGLTDVNNGVCGFIYKNVGWRGCGILVPMTDVVTDYNMFVGRLSGENKLKWVGVK